ncbi:MAG: choice-of-anchor J domain-containing protein [Candidatus Cloacimonetes bacterium]|nr:choice-of-anchor J domain-containing protein [Candidatus Cloacimonadota bacterium]
MSAINDYYNSNDEGDQVGSVSLAVVDLPFNFRLYGQNYSQITVCSNGFIALGVTSNAEFRNFRLPGAMGPSPMIAGFWDDLAIGTGSGIYWWHNRGDNSVIVQWNQMRSGFNGTSIITFQIILYDPAYYATTTGDGPIKIQYKTFNNVNVSSGNKHGNYCTIGIQNHDQTIGLEYTFNNTYPTAASPLGHQRAIYITTVPVIQATASIHVDYVYVNDDNDNQLLEPGESANLSICLSNNGLNNAHNVSAILSTSDPYVTISNNTANFGTINGLDSAFGSGFYSMVISASCPNNRTINFILAITSGRTTWTRTFTLKVQKAALVFHSWSYDDFALNNNGLIDPGETGKMQVNIYNESLLTAENVVLTLSESSPYISFTIATINCGEVSGKTIFQAVTQVVVSSSTPAGTTIPVTVNITSSNSEPHSSQYNLTVGLVNYAWDFEANNGGFTVSNNPSPGWEWGTSTYAGAYSGSRVWGTVLNANYAHNATYQLISPSIAVGSQPQLKFRHRYYIEYRYDGGQVQISNDNGNTWSLLTPQGGYPHQSIDALGYQPGYTGQVTTWQEAIFNLSAYANQTVRFRWHLKSDYTVAYNGWFIDDVQVTQATGLTDDLAKISGLVSVSPSQPSISPLVKVGSYMVKPAINGTYEVIIPSGTYEIRGLYDDYRSSVSNLNVLSQNTYTSNISMTKMQNPDGLTWAISDNSINLRWNPLSEPSMIGYKVYRKIGTSNWQMATITPNNSVDLDLSTSGAYDYRICTLYIDNWESKPTDKIHFIYPYSGVDVKPLNPQNLHVASEGDSYYLSWDPVVLDTEGNAITVWAYQVYAGATPDFVMNQQSLLITTEDTSCEDAVASGLRFYKVVALIGYINQTGSRHH